MTQVGKTRHEMPRHLVSTILITLYKNCFYALGLFVSNQSPQVGLHNIHRSACTTYTGRPAQHTQVGLHNIHRSACTTYTGRPAQHTQVGLHNIHRSAKDFLVARESFLNCRNVAKARLQIINFPFRISSILQRNLHTEMK